MMRTTHKQKVPRAARRRLPDLVRPMLAQAGQPFDSDDHLFEIKWDGARCLAFIERQRLRLTSRRGLQMHYPELAGLSQLPAGTVLDAEVVVLEGGKPSLLRLQQRASLQDLTKIQILSKQRPVTLMVFDLLYLRHENLMNNPLIDRRRRLEKLIEPLDDAQVLVPNYVLGCGKRYFAEIKRHGLEGVMAKRSRSHYQPGRRSRDWIKIKDQGYRRRARC